MDVVAGLLTAQFRRDDDAKHSRQVPQNGKRNGQCHEENPFPSGPKRDKSINRGEQKNCDQTPDAAASRGHVVLVGACWINQLCSTISTNWLTNKRSGKVMNLA